MKKKILAGLFLFLFFSFLIPGFSALAGGTGCPEEGLVPCGTLSCPCEFCDFFVMFQRIVNFVLFKLVPPVAALMLAIGGFMLIFSYASPTGGGPGMLGKAKSLFTAVIIGLLIIYGAWLIINLFFQAIGATIWTGGGNWWTIPCETTTNNTQLPKPPPPPPPAPIVVPTPLTTVPVPPPIPPNATCEEFWTSEYCTSQITGTCTKEQCEGLGSSLGTWTCSYQASANSCVTNR